MQKAGYKLPCLGKYFAFGKKGLKFRKNGRVEMEEKYTEDDVKSLAEWLVAMSEGANKIRKERIFMRRLLLVDTGIIALLVSIIALSEIL